MAFTMKSNMRSARSMRSIKSEAGAKILRRIASRISSKLASYSLMSLLLWLQYLLWLSDGGVLAMWHLTREIGAQQAENVLLRERNAVLNAEVMDLKGGLAAIEELARSELGMVKKGETFFQVTAPAE